MVITIITIIMIFTIDIIIIIITKPTKLCLFPYRKKVYVNPGFQENSSQSQCCLENLLLAIKAYYSKLSL